MKQQLLKKHIWSVALTGFMLTSTVQAATLGTLANNITATLGDVLSLVTGFSVLAGVLFVIFGLTKLKQHRDNPAQTPLGVPIMWIVIGLLLLFLKQFISSAGGTVFGTSGDSKVGSVQGFSTLGSSDGK